MAEFKTSRNDASVNEFIESVEDEERRNNAKELIQIMESATGEKPEMWGKSIIGFGSYKYKYSSGKEGEWMRVGFSPRKSNLTIYIMTGFEEYAQQSGYNPEKLLSKLGPYKTGKSCLYIKRLEDIDKKILKQLVQESYEHMGNVH